MSETFGAELLFTAGDGTLEQRMLRLGRKWKWRCDICPEVSDWYPSKHAMLQGAVEHRLTEVHRARRRQRRITTGVQHDGA